MFQIKTEIKAIIPLSGNIGSGKTTFLNALKTQVLGSFGKEIAAKVVVIEEPTEEWLKCKTACGKTFFEKMYNSEPHAAFHFQILALSTRIQKIITTVKNNPSAQVFVIERSVNDDRYVFAEKLAADGLISPDELALIDHLKSTWDQFVEPYICGGLYLKVSPETAQERLHKRLSTNIRSEEAVIQLAYLSAIHDNYEKLTSGETSKHRYITVNGEADNSSAEYFSELKRCVGFILSILHKDE